MKKIPLRMCLVCRQMKEKNQLIRVVRTPDAEIIVDFSGKANGRGAYVCKSCECINKCIKSKALERQLKTVISQEITDKIIDAIK